MKHELDNARRHAMNTIAEANHHLDSGKIKDPRQHHMLTDMIEKSTRTLDTLNRMDDRTYDDDNAENRRVRTGRVRVGGLTRRTPRYDMNDKYDDYDDYTDDDAENRRVRAVRVRRRTPRYDMNDRYDDNDYADYDDYADDDAENMPRWRSARTGRFLPNLYGRRNVQRVRRRSRNDIDDMDYDDYNDADRAVNAVSDLARQISNILPGTPIMPRDDRNYRTNDTRNNDTRNDDRNDNAIGPRSNRT